MRDVFTLPSPELGGDSSAAQPPHFSQSLQQPLATSPPSTYLSYLLCRSFSICGRTVVHRSSFHRELGRGTGTCAPGPAHSVHPAHRSHLRFLIDDVKEVHYHGQVTDGHGRVHGCLQTEHPSEWVLGTEQLLTGCGGMAGFAVGVSKAASEMMSAKPART